MRQSVIIDTGPLVAALNATDHHHDWARAHWMELEAPLLTCEAVIAEAGHLLRRASADSGAVVELIRRGALGIAFSLQDESTTVGRLIRRYANVPMSLADACLVRMSEQHPDARVLTMDADFRVYRKHGRQVVPTIMPPAD